jgi:hypothetical protein
MKLNKRPVLYNIMNDSSVDATKMANMMSFKKQLRDKMKDNKFARLFHAYILSISSEEMEGLDTEALLNGVETFRKYLIQRGPDLGR